MDTAVQIILAGGLTGSLLLIVALARSGYGKQTRTCSDRYQQPADKER